MNIERKKKLLNIIIEIVLIILLIIIINIIPKNNSAYVLSESTIGVIGSSDGPTTILLGREFDLINFIRNLILVIAIISLSILLIIDIISFIKSTEYRIKYKLKIVLSIDIFLIIMILIYFASPIFGLKFLGISVLINIALLTFIFIREILLKIIKHEESK